MNKFFIEAETRMQILERIIADKRKKIKNAPEGRLKICGNNFYHVTEDNLPYGVYIDQANFALIKALAQKNYDQKVLKCAKEELKSLSAHRIYSGEIYEDVYKGLSLRRQRLVVPDVLTDEMYIKAWLERPYEKKGFKEGAVRFKTDKGEFVRSKSEVLIANVLFKYDIPYLYEYPVRLKNGRIIYPDFNVLDVRIRKDKFWEHLGLMGNMEYADNAVCRVNELARAGVVPGKDLILTMENESTPLDLEALEMTVKKNFRND